MQRDPVFARAQGRRTEPVCGDFGRFDCRRADVCCQIGEFRLGIDDHRRHIFEGFFDDAAKGCALTGAARPLDQETACEELVEIEVEGAGIMAPDRDAVPLGRGLHVHEDLLS